MPENGLAMPAAHSATTDLFATAAPEREALAPGAWVLRGHALASAPALLTGLEAIAASAPWRRPLTPGGRPFSVDMTHCGDCGWTSDRRGYRYEARDPLSGLAWPAMPADWLALASDAAAAAGYDGFTPDTCLVNRYAPGASMGLHQDRDEQDFAQPIVSVSLGLPATFLFCGATRTAPRRRVPLVHGDIVVWGGPSRLFFHGIGRLAAGAHPATGAYRINLTFRRAG